MSGLAYICAAVLLAILPQSLRAQPLETWYLRYSNATTVLFRDVVFGGGRFVAVGRYAGQTNGFILTSDTGVDWTNQTSFGLGAVAYGNSQFVAVGDGGAVVRSSDGLAWTTENSGVTNQLSDITFGNAQFVAVGSPNIILTSSNGVDWFHQVLPPANLGPVAFGNGRFLVLYRRGDAPTNYVSTNGWDWSGAPVATDNGFYSFGFARDAFLLFDNREQVFASADGSSWSLIGTNYGSRSTALAYGHGYFVLTGPVTEYSPDARGWKTISNPNPQYGSAVAFGNGTFLVAGNGRILQSDPVVRLKLLAPGSLLLESPVPAQLHIQAATNLSLPTPWQVADELPVTNSPLIWTDTAPSPGPQRFYRGVLVP
jgi:hypothetical protein